MKRVSELVVRTELGYGLVAKREKRLYLCVRGPSTVRQVGDTGSVHFAQKAVIDFRKIGVHGCSAGPSLTLSVSIIGIAIAGGR